MAKSKSKSKSSSDLAVPAHQPYVRDDEHVAEFSLISVVIGAVLGIIFGASSLYLVLKVGITISASIPVAVIAITLFKWFSSMFGLRRATILENNIVQTTGSAGESIAFGVGVTMPALMILGYDMEMVRVLTVASLGGLLGVLMMIPLRRGLIVKQHGVLTYPEGTACAQVLIAGEKGGTNAKTVFSGFFLGFFYKLAMSGMKMWKDVPEKILTWYKGVAVGGELAPELLGVGYIIGPATSCIMMAGGVLSTLVLIPLIRLFGDALTQPLYPGTTLISAMETHDIWKSYVLYIGAGAVAAGGIISLFSSIPLIISSFRAGIKDFGVSTAEGATPRTDRDLPLSFVIIGSILLVAAIWASPMLNVNLVGAVLILLFGFLFVTVSSRLTGEIGSSSNPISGMTVSTLILTCLIFLGMGWTGAGYRLTALSIAAVVCIAASNGGTTSQDLKTGYLVGATPYYQQIAILVGALTSAVVIGGILLLLNNASTIYTRPRVDIQFKADVTQLKFKEKLPASEQKLDAGEYWVMHLNEPAGETAPGKYELQPGKYLVDDQGKVAYIVDPGINGTVRQRDSDMKYEEVAAKGMRVDPASLKARERVRGERYLTDTTSYLVHIQPEEEGATIPAGRYLADQTGLLALREIPGPTVPKYDSPKAKLMSLIIDGILTMKLPWILVIIGAFIALVLELCRVSSLPFAVGVYLPFSASVPIFMGGVVRWLVDRKAPPAEGLDAESSPGVLLSSGLIAGGAIAGIALALLAVQETMLARLDMTETMGWFAKSDGASVGLFLLLAAFLYAVGREWILRSAPSK